MESETIKSNNVDQKPKKAERKPKLPIGCVKVQYTKKSSKNGLVEIVGMGYAKMMEKRGMLLVIER